MGNEVRMELPRCARIAEVLTMRTPLAIVTDRRGTSRGCFGEHNPKVKGVDRSGTEVGSSTTHVENPPETVTSRRPQEVVFQRAAKGATAIVMVVRMLAI